MDKELGITMEMYCHRNVFLGFDLTTTGTLVGLCFELSESQNMEIEAHIREAKEFPIEMIVYTEYDAELEIQPRRESGHALQCVEEDELGTNRKRSEEKCQYRTTLSWCVCQRHPALKTQMRILCHELRENRRIGQSLGVHAYRQIIKHLL